jgi:D-aminopeptidase
MRSTPRSTAPEVARRLEPRSLGMIAGVDDGVQAVCMIGHHSRAQGRGSLALLGSTRVAATRPH